MICYDYVGPGQLGVQIPTSIFPTNLALQIVHYSAREGFQVEKIKEETIHIVKCYFILPQVDHFHILRDFDSFDRKKLNLMMEKRYDLIT